MPNETGLKECPFCGKEAELTSGYYNDLAVARVDCTGCRATVIIRRRLPSNMDIDDMEKVVVDNWNRRAS